jgi:hypothetical protein
MNDSDLVEIGNFSDYYRATLAKEILVANGIDCIIKSVSLNVLDLLPQAPVTLLVGKDSGEKARELLDAFFDTHF